ncbi:MAG: hypothetical protein JWL68_5640 [Actinomycetia bacterium]|nr:hypothetical protein [Actinomycetes bacterium]
MTARRSPRRDPVVRVMKAAAAVLVVVALTQFVPMMHRAIGLASLHCPAPDHAVWADSFGPWYWRGITVCGASLVLVGTGK